MKIGSNLVARDPAPGAGHPIAEKLMSVYRRTLEAFGPQGWWPGETPFEICIGAILTQNTNWRNVERSIAALKASGLLHPSGINEIPVDALARLIRPAGYYNVKAARVKSFVELIFSHFSGKLEDMFDAELEDLRDLLLGVKGIGPETADSMLLYAFQKPTFVVDAYTTRILARHDMIYEEMGYEDVRRLFMDFLPRDVGLFNEYHALLVRLGKEFCRKARPRCKGCPLEGM